jgi:hypothetical protein
VVEFKAMFGKAPRADSWLNAAGALPNIFFREKCFSADSITKRLRAEKNRFFRFCEVILRRDFENFKRIDLFWP